ncbi:MAG: LysR substrate-binding domain-containing protein [Azospirillaceae bacterium]
MTPITNVPPELLRAFVTVVDSGGFSAAAERLRRGQSAISLQIKRLEERLGRRLLERNPRHLALTLEGETILDHARRILRLNDELVARVREPELAGLVRFGAPEDFATSHLPNVLARFTASHPRVALEVTCELTLNLLDRFQAGELDVALVKRMPAEAAAVSGGLSVWREPLVWAARDPDIARAGPALPLVASPRPCVYRKRATEALDAIARPWRIAYTCGSLAGSLAAVRAGIGVTVLPKEMVPGDVLLLSEAECDLPPLADTEIALIEAADLSPPAARLRDTIIRELEHRTAV